MLHKVLAWCLSLCSGRQDGAVGAKIPAYTNLWQQCKVKIKKFTATYRKLKDSNRRSGRDRADFPFQSIIDGVLGTSPATQPVNLLSSTSSNLTPPLERPEAYAYDSEEASPSKNTASAYRG